MVRACAPQECDAHWVHMNSRQFMLSCINFAKQPPYSAWIASTTSDTLISSMTSETVGGFVGATMLGAASCSAGRWWWWCRESLLVTAVVRLFTISRTERLEPRESVLPTRRLLRANLVLNRAPGLMPVRVLFVGLLWEFRLAGVRWPPVGLGPAAGAMVRCRWMGLEGSPSLSGSLSTSPRPEAAVVFVWAPAVSTEHSRLAFARSAVNGSGRSGSVSELALSTLVGVTSGSDSPTTISVPWRSSSTTCEHW
mmetsp:Transcript_76320/g.220525  ORF Transcript_76320/g.220525 Transcript_76320/m.220525 type:complete len:253 (-) Transcript_76320:81-839(-)